MMKETFGDRVINVSSTSPKEKITDNNKLIAEFMDVPQGSHTHFMIEPFALESYADVDDLRYDTSWDWLMPVVAKCRDESNPEDSHWEAIYYSLEECDIDVTHHTVVEFITNYNKS